MVVVGVGVGVGITRCIGDGVHGLDPIVVIGFADCPAWSSMSIPFNIASGVRTWAPIPISFLLFIWLCVIVMAAGARIYKIRHCHTTHAQPNTSTLSMYGIHTQNMISAHSASTAQLL